MPRAKKEEEVQEVTIKTLPTLDSIVLDTEKKQAYMRVLETYKKQNPVKFAIKEESFIKKLLSL